MKPLRRKIAIIKWIWQWGEILHEFDVTVDIPPPNLLGNAITLTRGDIEEPDPDQSMFKAPKAEKGT